MFSKISVAIQPLPVLIVGTFAWRSALESNDIFIRIFLTALGMLSFTMMFYLLVCGIVDLVEKRLYASLLDEVKKEVRELRENTDDLKNSFK